MLKISTVFLSSEITPKIIEVSFQTIPFALNLK